MNTHTDTHTHTAKQLLYLDDKVVNKYWTFQSIISKNNTVVH